MPNPFVGVRIPPALNRALIERMRETGQSKSEIVIAALKSYLGLASCQERLDQIEERLSVIETAIGIQSWHHHDAESWETPISGDPTNS